MPTNAACARWINPAKPNAKNNPITEIDVIIARIASLRLKSDKRVIPPMIARNTKTALIFSLQRDGVTF